MQNLCLQQVRLPGTPRSVADSIKALNVQQLLESHFINWRLKMSNLPQCTVSLSEPELKLLIFSLQSLSLSESGTEAPISDLIARLILEKHRLQRSQTPPKD